VYIKKRSPNLKSDLIKNTTDKAVGRNLLLGYMVKLDRAKKEKAKSIKIKHQWKLKYLKLMDKYKKLKVLYKEMYEHP
tara:strand:- start:1346 stop:1579 length:234 start_codon:yes stop_codon:yes gene_type:complete